MAKRRSRTSRPSSLREWRQRFDEVNVREKKIDIYTVLDGLSDTTNDYSEMERQFRGGKVRLIDPVDSISRNLPRSAKYRHDRQSLFEQLLNDGDAPAISVVIPVVVGRKTALRECLASLQRQTFVLNHPSKVEIVLVQDGIATAHRNPLSKDVMDQVRQFRKYRVFRLNPTSLSDSKRRATARNVGVFYSSHGIVFFVDSSMVLERNFLAEHVLRHARTTGSIALIGFKQNIYPKEYRKLSSRIRDGDEMPKYIKDWKWKHGYMQRSNWLRSLRGTAKIGRSPLVRFFHTGVTSVRLDKVKDVGGFHSSFDGYWGMEDTFLGALLVANGTKLVPCPSSVAYMIKHREAKRSRDEFDLARNRSQYERRLNTALRSYRFQILRRHIQKLRSTGVLELIEQRPHR